MIIVVLGSIGFTACCRRRSSRCISASFRSRSAWCKGLRSPDTLQLELMHTYSASKAQTSALLRWPASLPFLFASLQGRDRDQPGRRDRRRAADRGARPGLGARLLTGSYYGQTVQIWSALDGCRRCCRLSSAVGRRSGRGRSGWLACARWRADGMRAAAGDSAPASCARGALALRRPAGCWLSLPACVGPGLRLGRRSARVGRRVAARRCRVHGGWRCSRGRAGPAARLRCCSGCRRADSSGRSGRGFGVPRVLLPAPLGDRAVMAGSSSMLGRDFYQTILEGGDPGLAASAAALGFAVALLVDRVPFLQRGLLPLGNFREHDSARRHRADHGDVVRLRLAVEGRRGGDHDLLSDAGEHARRAAGERSHGARPDALLRGGLRQTLVLLRLPSALPFIFNALKINSTLAMIGAIVAEFFGSPIVGMGFRISTEVGRMNIDLVWGDDRGRGGHRLAVLWAAGAARARLTFWHPPIAPTCCTMTGAPVSHHRIARRRKERTRIATKAEQERTHAHDRSVALAAAGACCAVGAQAADKLTVQLKWVTAGAVRRLLRRRDKGFYDEAELDVTIKPGGPDIAPAQVIAGNGADVIVELDAGGAGVAREGRAAGQHRADLQTAPA